MRLRTLGGLALEGSSFGRPKPLLLLAHLSLEGPKPRRYLADLFYSGTSDPLNGLSRALSFLKAEEPGAFGLAGDKLQTLVECDAKRLVDLLNAKRFEDGVAAYRGPFLEGVDLALGEELEEWVYGTREFLAARVRSALLHLGELHAAQGRLDDACRYAEAACEVPGAAELEPEDFSRTYAMLAAGGSPRAAAVRKEATTFGLHLELPAAPLPAAADGGAARARSNLPVPGTLFLGREAEIAMLLEQLLDPGCRLVTVLGPGGVGKSRLALEVARAHLSRENFPGGVFFLPVEPFGSAELLVMNLAEVMGIRQDARNLLGEVQGYLRGRPALLILDSYEHLTQASPLIGELLEACPALKVLVTSRERLYSEHEWVFTLDGLPVPQTEGELFGERPQAAALNLFMHRAKRARLGFALTPEELPAVLHICQLVGGFPLGIELAAAWVGVLPPAEIAREIGRDRSFLASQLSGVPERHRSVRAVFESSWRRLSEAEGRALRRLSVFRGGFRKAAATAVSGVTIPVLTSLVDKSLLRIDATGRYDRHALLHQYMKEKLAEHPDDEAQAVDAHGRFYHHFLQQMERPLLSAGAQEATAAVQEELENLRLAWDWALRRGAAGEIRRSAPPLRVFFDRWGRFGEGIDFFERALVSLHPTNQRQRSALGIVLVEQAWLVFRLGRRGVATSLAERGLSILRELADPKGLLEGLYILGALRLDAGEYDAARGLWHEALTAARGQHDQQAVAHSLELLGIAEEFLGNALKATAHYQESLDLSVHLGDKEGMVDTLNNLAALLIDVGDAPAAEPLLHRGIVLAREVGAGRVVPYLLDNLAKVAYERRDYVRAARLGSEALTAARDSGEKALEARVLETLGRAALGDGDHARAEDLFRRGLRESHAMNALPQTLRVLFRMAELRCAQGELEGSAYLARAVAGHPAASEPDRKLALKLLATLGQTMVVRGDSVTALSNAPTLEGAVAQVLAGEPPAF